ncbi:thiolase domain-containing protein [Pseudooceanicola aestuarii]|uniref:thiolase domain-containing protein n=1 Tax=Pseudooceanicola aestuarii TaxID=2697319 RepID=UPI0013D3AD59|nr:thiolase domain-containing protein [Pseudooceanicola aestuarii]
MSIRNKAAIVGIYEHPLRKAPDHSTPQLHAEVARGALADAGLGFADVDGYFCAGDAPSLMGMVDYLGLGDLSVMDGSEMGGASYIAAVDKAAQAIALGKCRVALVTLAGRPRQEKPQPRPNGAEGGFELPYGGSPPNSYAMVAQRHMHEFGTTAEDLAWVKVAASHHAQWNENALLRDVVTVEDVLDSPMVADPLHRLDCCVVTDGGGAFVITTPEIARELNVTPVMVRGAAHAFKGQMGGRVDLTWSAAALSGPRALEEAGVTVRDIKYASIYDSFTITVIMQLEDLGFCEKGQGGQFVRDGGLISGQGRLPWNTDGGGLCNNHPINRGGMTKVIEAVRQLRGAAHPKVQVPDCDLALVTGIGGMLGLRHSAATCILERADA